MRFLLGYGSCGIASGADFVLEGLNEVLKDTEYTVEKVGCNGLCFNEPIVEVIDDNGNSTLYGRLNKESGKHLAECALKGELPEENKFSEDELNFLNSQKRIVLSGCGKVNPESRVLFLCQKLCILVYEYCDTFFCSNSINNFRKEQNLMQNFKLIPT